MHDSLDALSAINYTREGGSYARYDGWLRTGEPIVSRAETASKREGKYMFFTRRSVCLAIALTLGMIAPALADSPADSAQSDSEAIGPKLPDRVRGLLIREMVAIRDASQEILDALVRGQHERVAERAQAIHDSFILQQEMTEADREALMEAVPDAFVQRDRAFHELTGDLAAAARKGNGERQRDLFGQMVDACTACHARYAHDRFPGLRE